MEIATNQSAYEPESNERRYLERAAEGLLRGTLASACIAVVHLATLIPARVSLAPGLIAVAGATALTLGPLVALRRCAGAWPAGTRNLVVGIVAALPILAVLGAILFRGTHHRPLGAVTFGVLATCTISLMVVIVGRLADPARRLLGAGAAARFDWSLGIIWFGVAGGAVLLRAFRSPDAALVFSASWQLTAVLIAFIVASLSPWPRSTSPSVRALGGAAWILLVATSLFLLHAPSAPQGQGAGADRGFANGVLRAAPIVTWPWAGYR